MKMYGIHVEDFTLAYQKSAAELINTNLGKRFRLRDDSQNPDLYDIAAYYSDDCFVIALIDDRFVGTGALIYETQFTVRIVRVHTAESHRRRGVGSAILHELERRAIAYGAKEAFLGTDLDWGDARAFYIALGYREFRRNEVGIRFHKLLV